MSEIDGQYCCLYLTRYPVCRISLPDNCINAFVTQTRFDFEIPQLMFIAEQEMLFDTVFFVLLF